MPIFCRDTLAVFYSHVPKTGGTTVERFFHENGFRVRELDMGGRDSLNRLRPCSPQHTEAARVRGLYRIEAFDYVFMTVRHPIDRLVSEFAYRTRGQDIDINTWVPRAFDAYRRDPYVLDNHLRPQWEFILPGCEIFYQEAGYAERWAETVAGHLGVEMHATPGMENASGSTARHRYGMTEEVAEMARMFYELDFRLFGYVTS